MNCQTQFLLCSEFSIHYDTQYIQNTWENISDI